MTHVLAAPLFDPGSGRIALDVPEGLTVSQIIARALPQVPATDQGQLRVALVTAVGSTVIYPALWHAIRPRPGVQVVIRVIPDGDALRSVLSIVVAVAAAALRGIWGGPLAGALGLASSEMGVALATTGLTVLGNLALTALIPPNKPKEERKSYSIQGWQNRYEPDGAVPVVLGVHRAAPVFAAPSYTEIVGDDQYVRAVFTPGYGPLQVSAIRIGDSDIAHYDEVEVEVREGRPTDSLLTIYPRQVVEERVWAELDRPWPRNDFGEVISGPSQVSPVVRVTGANAAGAAVLFAFPAGLAWFDKKGRTRSLDVQVRIEQRPAGTSAPWEDVDTLSIRAAKRSALNRIHSWNFPTRGRWEVRVTMLTEERTDDAHTDQTIWAALQTLRPEYPLAFPHPLTLIAVRIKATHQLSGSLDNLSAHFQRPCLDYDHTTGSWIERVTNNPAAIYRYVLTSPANPRPATIDQLNLDEIEAWHDFCRTRGLTYSRVLEEAGTTLRDVLTEIAAAGRASPRHDGVRWGVTVDRGDGVVVDHIGPRNSCGFREARSYVQPPHAFRVKFPDVANDFRPAERLIRWPGYEGEVTLTEALEVPAKPALRKSGARGAAVHLRQFTVPAPTRSPRREPSPS
ncbi:hypothetical protein ACEYYB_09660 [Paracoccus sp. p4-l81]|uniref:TipJ family phage tail tip protein n=1 Tax=Paracoccus sp. p4-l81 TaxID=3342806 RepID=UPI0035B8FE2D